MVEQLSLSNEEKSQQIGLYIFIIYYCDFCIYATDKGMREPPDLAGHFK